MPAKIFHLDLYGKRQSKYDTLESLSIVDALWTEVSSVAPYYFFVPKNTDGQGEYEAGFWVNEIFPANVTGIVTAIDNLAIHYSREEATELARKILNSQNPYTEYGIKDQRKHKKEARIAELRESFEDTSPIPIAYRPFDTRYMYYTKKTECWINSPRYAFMRHMLDWENIWIVMKIGHNQELSAPIMITKDIIDFRSWSAPWMQWGDYLHPLYLYTDSETLQNTTPMFATDTGELPPLDRGASEDSESRSYDMGSDRWVCIWEIWRKILRPIGHLLCKGGLWNHAWGSARLYLCCPSCSDVSREI